MNNIKNAKLTPFAQKLRKCMTPEEKMLWYDYLKHLPLTVKRQKVIGQYIVDFYIAAAGLVIELDGSQHYEKKGMLSDEERDRYLNKLGLKVLRYSNLDIKHHFDAVCRDIWNNVQERQNNTLRLSSPKGVDSSRY